MARFDMNDKVVFLHAPAPIGHFLRVGTSGYRQLETLHGSGLLSIDRVVFEASMVGRQSDLLTALRDSGAELILDTNVAELSVPGKFSGSVKSAPWANPAAMLAPEDLRQSANRDIIGQIARFAVEHGFHVVQAPTHLLEASSDRVFEADLEAAASLRIALDRYGGKDVQIDYPLLISYAALRDPAQRRSFIAKLRDVPFGNLWLRVSGFGSDASPVGVRRYIAAVIDFHRIERPLIADAVGGLPALAAVAFGAAGGICHGVAEKERFNTSDWMKPPGKGGGGREKRVLVEGLDRLLSLKQIDVLMSAPGARRLFSCGNPNCCPRGLDDTLKDPKAHYLRQRQDQVAALSRVPDLRRAQHFLERQLSPTRKKASLAAELDVDDKALKSVLETNRDRLDKLEKVLLDLQDTLPGDSRSASPTRRGGPGWGMREARGRP